MAFVCSPFFLMFVAVITGLAFGKIKFGTFNFGTSGTLFTGLVVGWLAYRLGGSILAAGESAAGYTAAAVMMRNGIISTDFFNFFLILFVAAVGILAGKDLKAILRKYGVRFIIMGVLTTAVGFCAVYGVTLAVTHTGIGNASPYEVTGVYTGALTSSPGLAAALETSGKESLLVGERYKNYSYEEKLDILEIVSPGENLTPEECPELSAEQIRAYQDYAQSGVGIGHAVAYPFGVLMVIIAMNFMPKIFRMKMEDEWERYEREMAEAREDSASGGVKDAAFGIAAYFLAALVGLALGEIQIYLGPIGWFSLGSTGGVLIGALILGSIGKIGPVVFRMESKVPTALRELGLAFFLAVVGLRYGGKVVDALTSSGLQLVFATLIVSFVALLCSFMLGRYVFKLNWVLLSGAMCGGMTSTPGLGAAVDALKSDAPGTSYGAAYPFALLTKIILVILLHKLPM
jgi:putative transport protein